MFVKQTPAPFDLNISEITKTYRTLCRNGSQLPPKETAELKCYYVTFNNPVLLIGPLKQEVMYKKFKIIMYHDMIYQSEIDFIKNYVAKSQVKETGV